MRHRFCGRSSQELMYKFDIKILYLCSPCNKLMLLALVVNRSTIGDSNLHFFTIYATAVFEEITQKISPNLIRLVIHMK